jgi:hypothetical protein
MKKLRLDIESLGVETFAMAADMDQVQAGFVLAPISRRSCIEQCTTSCTEMV